MLKIILIICFIITGCASIRQELDPNILYRKDMIIEANGYKGIGTLVLPKADVYNFKIEALGKLDMLDFQTCHRQIIKEKAGNRGIFKNNNKTEIQYIPVSVLEDDGDCDILLGGYDIKGKHSWAYVSIESEKYKLPASIKCNGSVYNSNGITVCQSKNELIQEISFTEEVNIIPEANCSPMVSSDKKIFTYKMPYKECSYIFKVIGKELYHKLITLGYRSVLIREE